MILELFFDLASPYAYLAVSRALALQAQGRCTVRWQPVDVEELRRAAGNVGPSLRHSPVKLRYVHQDAARWARCWGVPYLAREPAPATALNRGTFFALRHGAAAAYLDRAARAVWAEGRAPESEETLRSVAGGMGWDADAFLAFVHSGAAAQAARASFARAREAGAFGVPTFVLGERLWWGNDRLPFIEELLPPAQEVAAHG